MSPRPGSREKCADDLGLPYGKAGPWRLSRPELLRRGPYRLFFPVGVLSGLIGVGHWTLWSLGWIGESRPFLHASLQVQGFLACFAAGFLMTAMPRFLGARPASIKEVIVSGGSVAAFLIFSLSGSWRGAEVSFAFLMANLLVFLGRRFLSRTKKAPTSFILIVFGLLSGLSGSLLMLLSRFGRGSAFLMESGRPMLQLGFFLCIVLGISGYLCPFLTGYAADPGRPAERSFLRGRGFLPSFFHAAVGCLIVASFFMDPVRPRLAAGLRAAATLVYMVFYGQVLGRPRWKAAPAFFFWISCWMVAAGFLLAFALPEYRIASLHVAFIGGYSLMIFSFGLLIVLSHAGQADLVAGRLIPLKFAAAAVLCALAMRAAADWDAWRYIPWIRAASAAWLLGASGWLLYLLPKFWSAPVFEAGGEAFARLTSDTPPAEPRSRRG